MEIKDNVARLEDIDTMLKYYERHKRELGDDFNWFLPRAEVRNQFGNFIAAPAVVNDALMTLVTSDKLVQHLKEERAALLAELKEAVAQLN